MLRKISSILLKCLTHHTLPLQREEYCGWGQCIVMGMFRVPDNIWGCRVIRKKKGVKEKYSIWLAMSGIKWALYGGSRVNDSVRNNLTILQCLGAQEDIICITYCFTFQPAAAEPSCHVAHWYHILFTLIFSI